MCCQKSVEITFILLILIMTIYVKYRFSRPGWYIIRTYRETNSQIWVLVSERECLEEIFEPCSVTTQTKESSETHVISDCLKDNSKAQ